MLMFFSGLFKKFWPYIVAIGTAVATIIAVFLKGQSYGKNSERVKNQIDTIKQQEKANEVNKKMLNASSDRPASRDELRKRLLDNDF